MSMENKEKRKKMQLKIFFGRARDDKVLIRCFSKFALKVNLTQTTFVLFGQSDAANSETAMASGILHTITCFFTREGKYLCYIDR